MADGAGRAGVGLLVLAALLPIVLLPIGRRAQGGSGGWLLCALAPALGVIGLAGAFPAIAGQARRWRMRAALARSATGGWCSPSRCWTAACGWVLPGHVAREAAWEGSLQTTPPCT